MRTGGLARTRVQRLASAPRRSMVVGRFVRAEPEQPPMAGMRVEIFLDEGRRERFLGRGQTARDGRYHVAVELPPSAVGRYVVAKLIDLRPPVVRGEPPERRWRVVGRARSEEIEELGTIDLATAPVEHWLYRPGMPPRRASPQPELEEVPPVEEIEGAHKRYRRWAEVLLRQPWVGVSDPVAAVARAFEVPSGASVELDQLCADADPNGWSPLEEGGWRWETPSRTGWGPGVQLEVEAGRARRIWWSWRGQGGEATPADGEAWWVAGAVAAASLRSAVVEHWLARQVMMEGWAVATSRTLRASPLLGLLQPHLRDVCGLNALAEGRVLGTSGMLLPCLPGGRTELMKVVVDAVQREATLPPGPPRLRWPQQRHDRVGAIVAYAIGRGVGRHFNVHRDALADQWHEVVELAGELSRADILPLRLGGARRPDDGDLEALADWTTRVLYTSSFGLSWAREQLAVALLPAEAALTPRWEEGRLAVQPDAETYAHRAFLARAVCGGASVPWVEDPLDELVPLVREEIRAVAGQVEAAGWAIDKLSYRARP
jgi:hypothetical protein